MDMENRINKARAAFDMLSIVWRNNNLSTNLKLGLFKCNVVFVLLYECCTWKVSKNVTSRISNEELLRIAEIEPVEIRIRRHKKAWIGHTLRKGEDNIARMAMEWNPFDCVGRAPGGECQT